MTSKINSLQDELSNVLQAPALRFNEQNGADYRLDSGQWIHLRCSRDASGLLFAAPLGQLRQEHLPRRAMTLLMANHQGLAFGGAFGYDSAKGEVFASRYFPLADGAELRAALSHLEFVGLAMEAASAQLALVNSIELDEFGNATIPGINLVAANQAAAATWNERSPEPNSAGERAALVALEEALSAAVRYCGIPFSGLDDEHCWYAECSDGVTLRVAVDPRLESIALVANIVTCHHARALGQAHAWLESNLFVRDTGNCVLGIAEHTTRPEFLVTLSLLTSSSALGPSPTALGNLITGILSNAQRMKMRFDQALTVTNGREQHAAIAAGPAAM